MDFMAFCSLKPALRAFQGDGVPLRRSCAPGGARGAVLRGLPAQRDLLRRRGHVGAPPVVHPTSELAIEAIATEGGLDPCKAPFVA